MRLRVHIGIATAFTLMMLALIGGIVGFLYLSNSRLALTTASRAMDRSTEDVVRGFEGLLTPVARAVENAAHLAQSGGSDLRTVKGLEFFFNQFAALPQLYGMFIGYESDGAFYQVVRVIEGIDSFGPSNAKPDPQTRFAIRILDDSPGYMADSYVYLADWDNVTGVERGQPQFDPRVRPWYTAGVESKSITISDPYFFSSTGKLGLTVSRVATTGSGDIIGTAGADITLEDFAVYLNDIKVGQRGRIFVLDSSGNVIVQSQENAIQPSGSPAPINDEAIASVIDHFDDTGENKFTLPGAIPIMASFKPFPDEFHKPWVIGVVADQNEFVSEIRQTTLRVLLVASLIVGLAIITISVMSKRLTAPLRQVVKETGRIRNFDLDGTFSLHSSVIEINDLVNAVQRMKNSLRSFGAYVPTDLVRSIVSSGTAVQIGGEQRELTLLFSDIESFTNKSEKLTPERIFSELSVYFSAVSGTIRRHHGTVDKFIGDAVMAFWNAPKEDPDHAITACQAVLACLDTCRQLNASNAGADGTTLFPVATRFALHCGDVMVGNVGSVDRMQYTALGSAVNLASRVEGLNKRYGTQLLITETVAEKVTGRFLMRAIDIIAPAGVSVPITVYELLGEIGDEAENPATPMQESICKAWEACMAVYGKRDWDQAVTAFQGFLVEFPEDGPAKHYLARCQEFALRPPPTDWDGVIDYDTK